MAFHPPACTTTLITTTTTTTTRVTITTTNARVPSLLPIYQTVMPDCYSTPICMCQIVIAAYLAGLRTEDCIVLSNAKKKKEKKKDAFYKLLNEAWAVFDHHLKACRYHIENKVHYTL